MGSEDKGCQATGPRKPGSATLQQGLAAQEWGRGRDKQESYSPGLTSLTGRAALSSKLDREAKKRSQLGTGEKLEHLNL